MGGVAIALIIKIGIFLIIKVMIQMGNLLVLIRIIIKERGLYENLYKQGNWEHLPKPLGIRPVVIYVETPNMPSGMERRSLRCFRCCQIRHYANECPNQSYTEDYAPICGNCKQSSHTTDQCNAPFNFNNRNQQMQTNNPVEDKTRTLQEFPVNCVEVVQAVQT